MTSNKEAMVAETLDKVWDMLLLKFPDKTFLPGYTTKAGRHALEITYCPLPFGFPPSLKSERRSCECCCRGPISSSCMSSRSSGLLCHWRWTHQPQWMTWRRAFTFLVWIEWANTTGNALCDCGPCPDQGHVGLDDLAWVHAQCILPGRKGSRLEGGRIAHGSLVPCIRHFSFSFV